jgi:addiction module HigA family antidote
LLVLKYGKRNGTGSSGNDIKGALFRAYVNITQAANKLGVARKTLSQLVNGHIDVSAEMAIRLSKALNTTPQLWMNMQQGYDLWVAEKKADNIHVVPFAIAS